MLLLCILSLLTLAVKDLDAESCAVSPEAGKCCHLPFFYKGKPYFRCIMGNAGKYWCAHDEIYDDDRWSYCQGNIAPLTQSASFLIEYPYNGYCLKYDGHLKLALCDAGDSKQQWSWFAYRELKNIGTGECLSQSSSAQNTTVMSKCGHSSYWGCEGSAIRLTSIKEKLCLQIHPDHAVFLAKCNEDIGEQTLKTHKTRKSPICRIRDPAGSRTTDKDYYLLKSPYFKLTWPVKYVRVFMVFNIDAYQNYLKKYNDHNRAMKEIQKAALESMSMLDKAYRMIKVRVLLAGIEIWDQKEHINVTTDYYVLKKDFRLHSFYTLRKKYKFESAVYIYGRRWSGGWSGAGMGDMCEPLTTPDNELFVMAMRRGTGEESIANLLSHEFGHQFYMGHSYEPESPCPTTRFFEKKCTMGGNSWPKAFSADFLARIRRYKFTCLDTKPKQSNIYKCGNGVIDPGEECDCGSSEDCQKNNKCCDGSICKLHEGAECSSEKCCSQCKYDVQKQGCDGQVTVLTQDQGEIREYEAVTNIRKHWHIKVASDKVVRLVIVLKAFDWSPGCKYDYLKVRDGGKSSNVMETLCLANSVKRIKTTSNEAFITYHSDGTFGGKFRIFFDAVSKVAKDCEQKTIDGDCCYLPFKFHGRTFQDCTLYTEPRPWCSLTPKYEGYWGFCKQYKEGCKVKTEEGKCCVLPFTYKGVEYHSCQPYKGKTWCYVDQNKNWDYCKP